MTASLDAKDSVHRYILLFQSVTTNFHLWPGRLITDSIPNEDLKTKTVQPFQFNASRPRNPFPPDIEALKKLIQEFEAGQ